MALVVFYRNLYQQSDDKLSKPMSIHMHLVHIKGIYLPSKSMSLACATSKRFSSLAALTDIFLFSGVINVTVNLNFIRNDLPLR